MYVFLSSLLLGSFIGALTYRLPRGLGFIKGRSFCDNCKKELKWYNNIPVISFLILGGVTSCCKRKISIRYPLIEIASALGATLIYLYTANFFLVFLFLLLFTIFVIDLEHQIIPDELSFLVLISSLIYNFSFGMIFTGFLFSSILLFLHLITKGKGMGLGDVKLTIALGSFFTVYNGLIWISLAFLTGGIIASILLVTGKAKMKTKLPFGPFLIFAFLVTYLFIVKFI